MTGPLVGGTYEIVVGGQLVAGAAAAFEGFDAIAEDGVTRLRGEVPDQAALHGVLARMRDLGISILEVRRVGETSRPPGDQGPPQRNTSADT